MDTSAVLIVTDRPERAGEVIRLVEAVLAHWVGGPPPRCEPWPINRLLDPDAKPPTPCVAWLDLAEPDNSQAYEAIGQLLDRHVPVLRQTANDPTAPAEPPEPGIIDCDARADPVAACGVLRGLLSQAGVIRALELEIGLLRAHQGGLADQITKLDEELRTAAQLQQEFLPRELVRQDGVAFHVLFRPAGYVSGDIYDVVPLSDGCIGFFIADAVGHGVPAALMTVYIKRSLKTRLPDPSHPSGFRSVPPGEALARLNRDMMAQQTGKVRFATACYGVIDTRTRRVTLARAGHPFPMVLRRGGACERLDPEGGLLGVFPEEVYEQASVDLEPGDRLLVFSDGFELAFPDARSSSNAPRRLANEQYTREFDDLRHGHPDDALERLAEKLDQQAGSLNQRDDLTVLCLAVSEEPAEKPADATACAADAGA